MVFKILKKMLNKSIKINIIDLNIYNIIAKLVNSDRILPDSISILLKSISRGTQSSSIHPLQAPALGECILLLLLLLLPLPSPRADPDAGRLHSLARDATTPRYTVHTPSEGRI